MPNMYDKAEIFVWSPLIGFENTDADQGAKRFLDNIPVLPHGIAAFIYHMDIVMQHNGLTEEVVLPPDLCAYNANARNGIRERQEWTNFEVKHLVDELHKAGTEVYLSIMGNYLFNQFHEEWISHHPELLTDMKEGKGAYNLLRRMKDGTYFEDFFIDKLCICMTDYGFDGLHATDLFCPALPQIWLGDFSTDMVEQFAHHAGIRLPEVISTSMGDDSDPKKTERGDYIWQHERENWIRFYGWRWGVFWKKLCGRLHALGKKVNSIGMYCTDPFENLYCLGVDLRELEKAGVDYLMPNICGTGTRIMNANYRDPFFNYMNMLPLISAFVPKEKLLIMLGIRDDTEEWDLIHHAPCSLERDIYMLAGYMRQTPEGYQNCADGFMMCLGDSLTKDDWTWLKERMDCGFYEGAMESLSPTLVWSNAAYDNMLPAYIETRRWTHHKYAYEICKRGTIYNTVVRIEDLDSATGVLFVPNFDLLPDDEKARIAAYDRGAVVCTAMAGFAPEAFGITPEIYFEDGFSNVPACVFAFGRAVSDEVKAEIASLLREDDGTENFEGNPKDMPDYDIYILRETIPFSKVTEGFANALALVLKSSGNALFTCDKPMMVMKLSDEKFRIFMANPLQANYCRGRISCKKTIKAVKNISKFPVLPVKIMAGESGEGSYFISRVTPDGMAIFDVTV